MVKHVFFDLDDTLLDFVKSERRAIRATLGTLGVRPTKALVERYHLINAAQWKLLERGEITREQVLHRRFALLFAECGMDCEPEHAQRIYEKELGTGHYFIAGAPRLLKQLARSYDLYLVTNGLATVQTSRLKSAGIAPLFRGIFISQEIGYNKPQPEYFEHCFSKIPGFQKENAVIIGDSLSSDMRGGNAAGIRTCWFNPHRHHAVPTDVQIDYEVRRLGELPALLKRL